MNTTNIAFLIVAVLAIAFAAWAILKREKTRKLKRQFGPEYDRTVDKEKNPNRAEAVLGERQKREETALLAIKALATLGTDAAHDALQFARKEGSGAVRKACAAALGEGDKD